MTAEAVSTSADVREAVAGLRRNIQSIASARKPRVLIVDDSVEDAILLRRQIENQCVPTEIETVSECEAALVLIREGHFDLCFLDLRFPKMSGVDLLRECRTTTPFIAITGLESESGQLREALNEGAIAVFKKPFSDEQMRMICGLVS